MYPNPDKRDKRVNEIIGETPIPKAQRSGGHNTPQLAAESVSKACFGVPVIFCQKTQKIISNLLKNQHAVAVTVKKITVFYGMQISFFDQVCTGKSANK